MAYASSPKDMKTILQFTMQFTISLLSLGALAVAANNPVPVPAPVVVEAPTPMTGPVGTYSPPTPCPSTMAEMDHPNHPVPCPSVPEVYAGDEQVDATGYQSSASQTVLTLASLFIPALVLAL